MTEGREQTYLQVTPTSEEVEKGVQETIESLHTLTTKGSPLNQINPFAEDPSPRFEFTLLSQGENEPVECYYGADDYHETLEERLRAIYPETFDIERVSVNLATKLVQPAHYTPSEFAAAAEKGELQYEFSSDERTAIQHDPESAPSGEHLPPNQSTDLDDTPVDFDDPPIIRGEDVAYRVAPAIDVDEEQSVAISKPTAGTDGGIFARPALEELYPVGVRWSGDAEREDDWMTSLIPFNRLNDDGDEEIDETNRPLIQVVNQLVQATQPIAFQVVFERRSTWIDEAEMRKHDLRNGRDTWFQKLFDGLLESPADNALNSADTQVPERVQNRIESIGTKTPKRSFTTNIRAIAAPPTESVASELDSTLKNLTSAFDSLSGAFYGVHGERLRESSIQIFGDRKAERTLQNVLTRGIETGRGKTKPDLVLGANELSNFIVLPSASRLSREGTRGTRAEQQSRNPLPRPNPDLMSKFREGMAIGYALDENGEPENEPVRLPPELLNRHYSRLGQTGAGKSKAHINEILTLYAETTGPTILIDPKGDGMPENYMRAHGRRFGMDDLKENVIHFPVPEVLPGFSFFNIESSLEQGRRRADAVQRKADHYEEILGLVMGQEKYDRATVAPTLIQTLIKTLFDEETGRGNGRYREDTDYFGHSQLEYALDQLWAAGPPNRDESQAPRSTDAELQRTIDRQLKLDANTFTTVMGGVSNRLAYISQDTHLRKIFNNTEDQFDFRDVLTDDVVVIFDLGDLRPDAARILTGLILTNLDDAIQEREATIRQQPDDFVTNLIIDEASSIAVSGIMNDLLEKGRGFRLSVGLSMQFPEQIEAEGGRKAYLNVLNNIGSPIVGKINVDQHLAEVMAHEEMTPEDFSDRVGSLPRGEWITKLPSPTFGETGPYPFSLSPLPIPEGHPESDSPLTGREEQRFEQQLTQIHQRASEQYGVRENVQEVQPSDGAPEPLKETLGTTNEDLDHAVAKVVRQVQLQDDLRDENGWVAVERVDTLLRRHFEDTEEEPPSYDTLTEIRNRSHLLEVDLQLETDTLVVRLSESGETDAAPNTGNVRAAGSSAHDAGLLQVEKELSSVGFSTAILEQDGSKKPDGRASHPDLEQPLAIEVETTTPDNPTKILENLRKAQETGETPVFVVKSGSDQGKDQTYWAQRVQNILSPPVNVRDNGSLQLYTRDSSLTFNGGARSQGGITAVRPLSDSGSRQNVWFRDGNDLVLADIEGTEYLRAKNLKEVTKERVPAFYTYDYSNGEYVVTAQGTKHIYEEKERFEADWARINEPFVPEEDLPHPDFTADTYHLVILPAEGDESAVVYTDGETHPLSVLIEQPASQEDGQPVGTADEVPSEEEAKVDTPSQLSSIDVAEDGTAGVSTFAELFLDANGDTQIPKDDLYDAYLTWGKKHGIDTTGKAWFSRRLGNCIEFETSRSRIDDDRVNCYTGFGLTDAGEQLLDHQ